MSLAGGCVGALEVIGVYTEHVGCIHYSDFC